MIPGIGAAPTDEGIDLDALVPPFSLVILIGNLVYIKALRVETWYSRAYKGMVMGLRKFIGMEEAPEQEKVASSFENRIQRYLDRLPSFGSITSSATFGLARMFWPFCLSRVILMST